MEKRDFVAGLLLLGIGLIVGYVSLGYGYTAEYGPGPGFIPFWLAVILVVLSLLMSVRAGLAMRKPDYVEKISAHARMFANPKAVWRALGTLFAVAATIEEIGFVLSVGLATTLYVKMVKADHRWANAGVIGFGASAVMYLFFNYVMGINLPKGVLPI